MYSEKNFQSAIGETQTITLSDGTIVVLNTNTQIRAIYSEKLRRIVLTSGEIMVSSAPDNIQPARPLVVDTDNGRLSPIGTRFNVRHVDQSTELNVFEGAVKIQPNHTNSMAIVTAGRQGRFDKQQIFDSNLEADNSRDAWTRGILLADNQPLCKFVSELNRYRQNAIICSSDVSHFKLVGAYPLTDTEQIIDAVESSLPIRFWQVNEKIWRVDMRR
jgi:transmembrane sensor